MLPRLRKTFRNSSERPRVAFFLPSLRCGGAERMTVNLVRAATAMGVPVDLVLAKAEGPFLELLPRSVGLVDLNKRKIRHAIAGLARYLHDERPFGLIARVRHANIAAVLARRIARRSTRVLVTEANHLSAYGRTCSASRMGRTAFHYGLLPVMRSNYRRADAVVAVSRGVANDLESVLKLRHGSVHTIANPVVIPELVTQAAEQPEHPWLRDNGPPVVLAVGRLAEQKDHPMLLQAFAKVRRQRDARLIIFGEGMLRGALEALRTDLKLDDVCAMPGHCVNPFSAMARARLFVLSSRREGSPNVLTEALACGCPVVSTDCPSGPRELLGESEFGTLVPVGDVDALAKAITDSLNRTWDSELLRKRVVPFSAERSAKEYLAALGYPLECLEVAEPQRVIPEKLPGVAA